jgi:hypothetical protein
MGSPTGSTGSVTTTNSNMNNVYAVLPPAAAAKAKAGLAALQLSQSSTAGGPSSNKTIRTFTAGATKANINTIWLNEVGRAASDKEVNAVTAAINAAMAANPDKTYNSGGSASTTQTTAGADMNQVIREQALKNPETAGYQAATTYYDALLNVLQGPVGGGF